MTQDARLMDFVRLKNGAIGQVIGISPTEIAIYDENAWQETKLKWKSKLPSNHNYTIYPKSDIENIYPVDKNSHIKKYSQICKISEIERKNGNYLVSGYTYNSGWNSLRAVKDPVTKQWITAQQPPFEFEKLAVGDKIIAYSLESEVVFIDQKSKKILVKNTDGSVCYGNAKSVKKTFGITMTDEQAAKLDAMVLISYDKNEFKDIKVKKESKDQLDLNLEKNPAPVVDTSSSTPLKVGDIVKIPHLASFRIILDIKDGKALIHTCPSDSIAIKEKSITAAEARKYIDFSFLNRLNRDNGISIYSSDNIYGFNWMPLSSVTKENVNWNNVASVSSIKAEDVVCLPSGEIVVVKGIIDDSIFFDYAYGNYSTVCQDWQYFFGGGKLNSAPVKDVTKISNCCDLKLEVGHTYTNKYGSTIKILYVGPNIIGYTYSYEDHKKDHSMDLKTWVSGDWKKLEVTQKELSLKETPSPIQKDSEVNKSTPIKQEFHSSLMRIGARKLTKTTKNLLLTGLKNEKISNKTINKISSLLDTEYGSALIAGLTSTILSKKESWQSNSNVTKLIEELKIDSLSLALDTAITDISSKIEFTSPIKIIESKEELDLEEEKIEISNEETLKN